MAVVAGCVRYPGEHNGNGETNYQLQIIVEVKGEINIDDGIYYIGLDTDGQTGIGVGSDIDYWEEDFYYVKFDGMGFYFAQVKDVFESIFDGGSFSGNKIQVTIALSDLGDPEGSIGINVVTTDLDGYTYDSLNDYFSIRTELNQTGEGGLSDDLEVGEADFDITKVTAVITTLY